MVVCQGVGTMMSLLVLGMLSVHHADAFAPSGLVFQGAMPRPVDLHPSLIDGSLQIVIVQFLKNYVWICTSMCNLVYVNVRLHVFAYVFV